MQGPAAEIAAAFLGLDRDEHHDKNKKQRNGWIAAALNPMALVRRYSNLTSLISIDTIAISMIGLRSGPRV